MINRVFFISDTVFQAGETLPAVDNIYFSILINPSEKGNLQRIYELMSGSKTVFALSIDISVLPDEDSIRFITSFLFLPSYLHINGCPVINLVGTSEEQLHQTAEKLLAYFLSQGVKKTTINIVRKPGEQVKPGEYGLFNSSERLIAYHENIFQSDEYYDQQAFFYSQTPDTFRLATSGLLKKEEAFKVKNPKLYHIAKTNQALEQELAELKEKLGSVQTELDYQKQHNDILRLEHSTKKLQDYYNQEYGVLPTWYKRFGHIIKVITGKRTFRSLFNDGVKKNND